MLRDIEDLGSILVTDRYIVIDDHLKLQSSVSESHPHWQAKEPQGH